MSAVEVQRFEAITGGLLTEDRQSVLIRLRDGDGGESVLAFPAAELPRLLYLADSLSTEAALGAPSRGGRQTVFGARRVEVAETEDGRLQLLSLFGACGAPFRFALDQATAHSLRVQLQRLSVRLVPRSRRG